jgi:hypothetical protein
MDNHTWAGGGSASTQSIFGELEQPTPARRKFGGLATPAPSKNVINAVYGYIRAIRALGRVGVNTAEISQALSISQRDVERAMKALADKGVRVRK